MRQSAEPVEEDIARLLDKSTNPTETLVMIAARVGQGLFRTVVSRRWGNRCAVSGCSIAEALRASHIKPWAESSDDERLDPHNGILLAAHVDALFDRYLVSFQGNGKLVVSSLLSAKELSTLGIRTDWRLSKPLSAKQKAFLTLHRREMKRREMT